MQQGDPLGSTLFALAIHPVLLEIGRTFPHVLITAYADNVVLSGPVSEVKKAHLHGDVRLKYIETHADVLARVLFIYGKLNPGVRYV